MIDMVSGIGSSGFSMGDMGVSSMRRPDPKEIFKKIDANEDGSLDASEVSTFEEEMKKRVGSGGGRKPPSLMEADTDSDSKISLDEFTAGVEKMRPSGPPPGGKAGGGMDISSLLEALQSGESDDGSDSLDTDKDGTVSPDELAAGMKTFMQNVLKAYSQGTGSGSGSTSDASSLSSLLNVEA